MVMAPCLQHRDVICAMLGRRRATTTKMRPGGSLPGALPFACYHPYKVLGTGLVRVYEDYPSLSDGVEGMPTVIDLSLHIILCIHMGETWVASNYCQRRTSARNRT